MLAVVSMSYEEEATNAGKVRQVLREERRTPVLRCGEAQGRPSCPKNVEPSSLRVVSPEQHVFLHHCLVLNFQDHIPLSEWNAGWSLVLRHRQLHEQFASHH